MSALNAAPRIEGAPTEMRGITLKQLREVYRQIEARCTLEEWTDRAGNYLVPVAVTLYDANKYLIKPATEARKCSYVELLAKKAQKPRFFVSHWWGEPVHDFLQCLEQHGEDWKLGPDTVYWVCAYANNQWDLASEVAEDPAQTSFNKAMDLAQGTITILDKEAVSYTRAWCAYEIYKTLQKTAADARYTYDIYTAIEHRWDTAMNMKPKKDRHAVGLTDGMARNDEPPGEEAQLDRQSFFPVELARRALMIDLKSAQASQESDRVHILNAIAGKTDLNSEPPTTHEAYDEINCMLRGRFVAGIYQNIMVAGMDMEPYHNALKASKLTKFAVTAIVGDRFADAFADDIAIPLASALPSETLQMLTLLVPASKITALGARALLGACAEMPHLQYFRFATPRFGAGQVFISQGGHKRIVDTITKCMQKCGWNDLFIKPSLDSSYFDDRI